MRTATLMGLQEVVVQYRLHVQRRVACSHREDANILLHHNNPSVLIHNFNIAALKGAVVLATCHLNAVTLTKRSIKLCHHLTVHLNAASLKRRLYLVAALLGVREQILKEGVWGLFADHILRAISPTATVIVLLIWLFHLYLLFLFCHKVTYIFANTLKTT